MCWKCLSSKNKNKVPQAFLLHFSPPHLGSEDSPVGKDAAPTKGDDVQDSEKTSTGRLFRCTCIHTCVHVCLGAPTNKQTNKHLSFAPIKARLHQFVSVRLWNLHRGSRGHNNKPVSEGSLSKGGKLLFAF